jgi:hypothetical protein
MLSWIESVELKRSGSKNSTTSSRPLVAAAELRARFDDLALHRLVDHAQAVLGEDEPERQRKEPGLFLIGGRGERAVCDLREQGPELRQIVGTDESVLLEKIAVRRDVGEQLDHEPSHLDAGRIEIVEQAHIAQQRDELGICRKVGRPERGAARRSEQQVLGHTDVRVIARAVEELDVRCQIFPGHAVANPRPRLEPHRRHRRPRLRIRGAREAEANHLLLHVDAPQHRERRVGERRRIGDTGAFVVDPVGANVVRAVARDQRVAHARLLALRTGLAVRGGAQRLMHEPVVQIVRKRSGEDVGVLSGKRHAPSRNRLVDFREVRTGDGELATRRKDEAGQEMRDIVLAAVAAADQSDVSPGLDSERHAVDAIGAAVFGVREAGGRDLSDKAGNCCRRIDRSASHRQCPAARTGRRSART